MTGPRELPDFAFPPVPDAVPDGGNFSTADVVWRMPDGSRKVQTAEGFTDINRDGTLAGFVPVDERSRGRRGRRGPRGQRGPRGLPANVAWGYRAASGRLVLVTGAAVAFVVIVADHLFR